MQPLRLLFVASPIAPMQSGLVGGVGKAIINAYRSLTKKGHHIDIYVPTGTEVDAIPVTIVAGNLQYSIQTLSMKNIYPINKDTFLANAWDLAKQREDKYDIIINFANDWLPYYLTSFFDTPVLHRVNVANENATVTDIITKVATSFPYYVAALTKAQAADMGIEEHVYYLGQGIDLEHYNFYQEYPSHKQLAFIARLSPEKGLEDAAEIAFRTEHKLVCCGYIQDQAYFDHIQAQYPDTIDYRGFLSLEALVKLLGECRAMLATHKWIEAFGQTLIESLACGVPVITYARGGPAEIIHHQQTGFVIEPDNIEQAINAVNQVTMIDRNICRKEVEEHYSLEAIASRYETWFTKALTQRDSITTVAKATG